MEITNLENADNIDNKQSSFGKMKITANINCEDSSHEYGDNT